ncbi:MAG: hypothetical protein U5L09_14155 [Bacteroidales bacterium]|nr:hypothetical protein [Bacteroidales bacterium]
MVTVLPVSISDLTLYRTEWIDKALTRNFSDYVANLTASMPSTRVLN